MQTLSMPAPARTDSRPGYWADARRLGLLLLLASAVHVAVVSHTEVAARDSIGFIRTARQLDGAIPPSNHAPARLEGVRQWLPVVGQRWLDIISTTEHPPGYSVALMLVSVPVRACVSLDDVDSMVLSAQITSAVAGVLLVVPVYGIGRRLFNARVGFIAAALFQLLPVAVEVTSDGVSEGVYLLAFASTLWLTIRAVREPSSASFVACGCVAGLAYLVRPEGALLAVVAGLFGVVGWLGGWVVGWLGGWVVGRSGWSLTWSPAVVAGFLLVAGPYMLLIGQFTNKPTGVRLIEPLDGGLHASDRPTTQPPNHPTTPNRSTAMLPTVPLAVWAPERLSRPGDRWTWGVGAVAQEWMRASHYGVGVLAILGLVATWRRLRWSPGLWVLLTVAGLQAGLLWWLAVKAGYVSERHTVPLALLGCLWAAAVLPILARLLARCVAWVWPVRVGVVTAGLLFVALMAGVDKTRQTLHANRAGHHAAGLWLAEFADPQGRIFDPYCWAHYYSGAVFREGQPEDPSRPPVWYVVIEKSENPHLHLPAIPDARKLADQGRLVYVWDNGMKSKKKHVKVCVYRVPGVK